MQARPVEPPAQRVQELRFVLDLSVHADHLPDQVAGQELQHALARVAARDLQLLAVVDVAEIHELEVGRRRILALLQQLQYAAGVLDRHREIGVLRAADAGGVDADDAAVLQADERPARVALVDGGVGLQELGAVAGGDAGNDAARAGELQPPRMAESADRMADRRHGAALELRRLDAARRAAVDEPHDRDVEERVDVDLGCLDELRP